MDAKEKESMTIADHLNHRRETPASVTEKCPYCVSERDALRSIGRKGGQAGKGASKRRGDSAYYKALRAKAAKKP